MKATLCGIGMCVLFAAVMPCVAEDDLATQFATPKPEFSPVPIWWWSGDRIERDRLREQLEKLAAGGIRNAIVLNLAPSGPLYGSAADDPPFLTEQWWEMFSYAVQEAKRVGVHLWFYDQLGFSGAGLQARVVARNQEFRGIALRRQLRDVTGPADAEIPTPADGQMLAAFMAEIDQLAADGQASWIWDGRALNDAGKRYFRRVFELTELPAKAELHITCDNGYTVYINGTKAGADPATADTAGWSRAEAYDVRPSLKLGRNVIAVEGDNTIPGPAGLLAELVMSRAAEKDQAKPSVIASNQQFHVSAEAPEGWTAVDFDDSKWAVAHVIGAPPIGPWGAVAGMSGVADSSLGMRLRKVRRITDQVKDGVLRVAVPQGPHRIQLFYTVPGGFDYHNPHAGAALIDVVHGEMERRFASELGKTIAGSFQDEFPAMPRFSNRLIREFRERAGYDILDKLPALYDDVIDQFGDAHSQTTIQIRCDASCVAAEMCEDAFFIPLHKWHEKYRMLCGYDQTVRNADPIAGEGYYVDYFKTMRHYSVPGNDQSGDAKPHQSIADLYNRLRVWMEGFHSSGWGQTMEEVTTLLHAWMAQGSTLYNPHAIYYSTHGSFYEWAPPDTGWRQPYFVHYEVLADYVSRLSFMLTRGRHVARIGVLHPATTIHASTGFGHPVPMAQQAQNAYWAVQNSLRGRNLDYIVVDEDSLVRAEIVKVAVDRYNGIPAVLSVGQARLDYLILPSARVLTGAAVRKLRDFSVAGGAVIIAGQRPEYAADQAMPQEEFAQALSMLKRPPDDPAKVAELFWADNKLPVLHRESKEGDFFFVLSDTGTPTTFNAEWDINKRKLWELPTARGGRVEVTLPGRGVPQRWDALTGQVLPVWNYHSYRSLWQVEEGANPPPFIPEGDWFTTVEVDTDTAAPVVQLRPAKTGEPTAVKSDIEISRWQRKGDVITLHGFPRLDANVPSSSEHAIQMQFEKDRFEGSAPAEAVTRIDVPGPLACKLEPTMDNKDGDFAWPPTHGPLPVEVRAFKFHAEQPGDDTAKLTQPDFDDSQWETVIASYGPRASWIGPMPLKAGQRFEDFSRPSGVAGKINVAEYSLKLGINEDPIYPSALGGKGRIPEEFIDLGGVRANDVYMVTTHVTWQDNSSRKNDTRDLVLRIGGEARKRAFLNNEEVRFEGDPAARVLRAPVKLRPGDNVLEVMASRVADGRLRLFYQFLPSEGVPPDPQWIWSGTPDAAGRFRFAKTIEVPGKVKSAAMVVALGDVHQILLNGKLVADQGNFDPYFTGRSERHDLMPFVQKGANTLEIVARDAASPVGLLLDGLIETDDNRNVTFVSDASFMTAPVGDADAKGTPARILAGPAQGYFGETATLLLRPRPHPLPEGGWLLNQNPVLINNPLVFAAGTAAPAPGWYRFRIPPGATHLTLLCRARVELTVNGRQAAAYSDEQGVLEADLPEPDSPSRVAVLRIVPEAGFERGAAIERPITFKVGPGRIPLGSWDELGLPHYCGGMVYSARIDLPESPSARLILDLGRVRGSVDVKVNGKACGTRIWHPYRFDITDAARAGANEVEIRVFNTLGPHFGVGHPSWHAFEGHTKSGIFGPISVSILKPVEIELRRVDRP